MNMAGLIIIMSLALYPYVYGTVRSSFEMQSPSLMEAARILGASQGRAFWTVALPSARPAIVAGISLVLMETFSEYGAVHYYGIENFTTGIFRAWFTLRDTSLALKLAGILLLFTFGFLTFEKFSRKKRGYNSDLVPRSVEMKHLSGGSFLIGLCLLLIPVTLGFFIPVGLAVYWTTGVGLEPQPEFWNILANTIVISSLATLGIIGIALVLSHASTLFPHTLLQTMTRLSSLGYAIPGAVVSLSILIFSNSSLNLFWKTGIIPIETAKMLVVQLGFVNLLFAFLLRYLAVALKPLESHYVKIGNTVTEAALSLGKSPRKALITVNLPMLRMPLLGGGLLVFIDLVKELPMTMILRPFNFETLAVKTYYYSSNEMLRQAAPYSLALVAIAAIPSVVIALTRIRQRRSRR
jgi:iron(III) transport system permease protein